MKRIKTAFPGVYYREVRRVGKVPRKGHEGEAAEYKERAYFIVFKQAGRTVEERVGYQFRHKMTPARAASIRAERIEGRRPSPKEIREQKEEKTWTLEALFDAWKEARTDLKGIAAEKCIFENYIRPLIGKRLPSELVVLDMDRIRIRMQNQGKAPQTVKNTLRLVSRVVGWGAERGYCGALPFKIKVPRVNNLKTEHLTDDELQRLMRAIEASGHPQAGKMILLALCSGMRRGEIFDLRWDSVDFQRGFIAIEDPKGGKDVTIPLNTEAAALLRSIPKEKSSPYVFPGRQGGPRRDIHRHLRKILDDAGIEKSFRPLHGMRHHYASTLASSGKVELYTIQKLLGHKDAQTTQRYAHLRDSALKEASELGGLAIAEAMKKKRKVISLAEAVPQKRTTTT
jgi:integrase